MKNLFENFLQKYVSDDWIFLIKNHIVIKRFTKNKVILSEGEKVEGVYFINTGKVKVVSFTDKNERLLRLSTCGDLLGHRALSSSVYPISAIALTDIEVVFIPIEMFKKLVRNNPDFALYVIDFLANDLKNTEEHMKSVMHNDVLIRIGLIICMLIDAFGYEGEKSKKLSYTLSRNDIANFVGTTYESVIRNLRKLEDIGIIKIENKSITVLKEKRLREIVSK